MDNSIITLKNVNISQLSKLIFKNISLNIRKGEFIYFLHADMEYDSKCVSDMVALAETQNLDAVFGSRIKDLIGFKSRWSFVKERPAYLATIISTYLMNRWYGYKFTDVLGAEMFRASVIKKVPIDTYNTGFKFEHVSRMCKNNLKIEEINVGYKPRANQSDKKIKSYHMVNALWAMFKVRYFEKNSSNY